MSSDLNYQSQFDLQPYNTMAVPCSAEFFCTVETEQELGQALLWAQQHAHAVNILGGGSNVILPRHLPGLTIQVNLLGKTLINKNQERVLIDISAGEDWHETVQWCLSRGFNGLENLALIPGRVGAAPVQNIGAYGRELCQFVDSLEYMDTQSRQLHRLSNSECCFGYRDSIFKQSLANRAVITSVRFDLAVNSKLEYSYPDLKKALAGLVAVSADDVFQAVCRVRENKLPNVQQTPNAGSFFKNPVVDQTLCAKLLAENPDMPNYRVESATGEKRKLAAGWLIDQAGWKGKEKFGVCMHDHQALVMTNPNKLEASRLLDLARAIKADIRVKFGVELQIEPRLL